MVTGFQPAKGIEIGIWNAGNGKTNKLDLRGTMSPSDVQTLRLRVLSNDSAVTQILAGTSPSRRAAPSRKRHS